MAKKWNGLAAALILSMALAGCDDGPQEIEGNVGINYGKAPQVGAVTVDKTTNNQYFIVSWKAVAGESNSYFLYFKQNGKISSTGVSGAQNTFKYDPATGAQLPNDDLDNWSYQVTSVSASVAGAYQFGVLTSSYQAGVDVSDIKWSDNVTLTPGPKVTTVTATPTSNNYITAVWTGVTGASYEVKLFDATGTQFGNSSTTSTTWTSSYPLSSGTYTVTVKVIPSSSDISVLPGEPVSSSLVTIP